MAWRESRPPRASWREPTSRYRHTRSSSLQADEHPCVSAASENPAHSHRATGCRRPRSPACLQGSWRENHVQLHMFDSRALLCRTGPATRHATTRRHRPRARRLSRPTGAASHEPHRLPRSSTAELGGASNEGVMRLSPRSATRSVTRGKLPTSTVNTGSLRNPAWIAHAGSGSRYATAVCGGAWAASNDPPRRQVHRLGGPDGGEIAARNRFCLSCLGTVVSKGKLVNCLREQICAGDNAAT